MIKIRKNAVLFTILVMLILTLTACGKNGLEDNNTESSQGTEEIMETEFKVEILDAEEILIKVWDEYTAEERFKTMGGHFTANVVDMPARFDLTQTTDLMEMYCVPEAYLTEVDDAATMIDMYNAGRFTAGVYHVTDADSVQDFAMSMGEQIKNNAWHGETPEKIIILKIDEQYVVAVYGRATLVDEFEEKVKNVYKTMARKMVVK